MNAIAAQASRFRLTLADGAVWNIMPEDPSSAAVVGRIGEIMMLQEGWRESAQPIHVRTVGRPGRQSSTNLLQRPIVCTIPPPEDVHLQFLGVLYLAGVLVQMAIRRGGMLVHGALAASGDTGVVLEGPANAGKTTASGRLPCGMASLCDDSTLIIADRYDHKGRWTRRPGSISALPGSGRRASYVKMAVGKPETGCRGMAGTACSAAGRMSAGRGGKMAPPSGFLSVAWLAPASHDCLSMRWQPLVPPHHWGRCHRAIG